MWVDDVANSDVRIPTMASVRNDLVNKTLLRDVERASAAATSPQLPADEDADRKRACTYKKTRRGKKRKGAGRKI